MWALAVLLLAGWGSLVDSLEVAGKSPQSQQRSFKTRRVPLFNDVQYVECDLGPEAAVAGFSVICSQPLRSVQAVISMDEECAEAGPSGDASSPGQCLHAASAHIFTCSMLPGATSTSCELRVPPSVSALGDRQCLVMRVGFMDSSEEDRVACDIVLSMSDAPISAASVVPEVATERWVYSTPHESMLVAPARQLLQEGNKCAPQCLIQCCQALSCRNYCDDCGKPQSSYCDDGKKISSSTIIAVTAIVGSSVLLLVLCCCYRDRLQFCFGCRRGRRRLDDPLGGESAAGAVQGRHSHLQMGATANGTYGAELVVGSPAGTYPEAMQPPSGQPAMGQPVYPFSYPIYSAEVSRPHLLYTRFACQDGDQAPSAPSTEHAAAVSTRLGQVVPVSGSPLVGQQQQQQVPGSPTSTQQEGTLDNPDQNPYPTIK